MARYKLVVPSQVYVDGAIIEREWTDKAARSAGFERIPGNPPPAPPPPKRSRP